MKRKADIYFVLYLTAIISFFVVENQVKEYKNTTNKLINRLAFREKLVTVQNASARVNRDTVIAELSLLGDFSPSSFSGSVAFVRKIDSVEVRTVLLERAGTDRSRFLVRIPHAKKVFGEKDTFFLVARLAVRPLITEQVRARWKKDLDVKTAVELEKRVASAGVQELTETIQETFNIVLNDVKVMPDLPFILSAPSSSINVLQGLEWSAQFSISGVPSPNDYEIEVLKGEKEYNVRITKDVVKVIIEGVARGSGEVKLRARNKINGKVSEVSVPVNIRTPRYVVQNPVRAFVGDTYTFDGRLESIAEENMRVSVHGAVEKEQQGAVLQDLPLRQPGTMTFSVAINDRKVPPLDLTVTVEEPPPPEIKYVSYKEHTVTVEVHSYGKINGAPNAGRISSFISGARNATKVNERVVGFTMVTVFELSLKAPREGNRVRLELKAKDQRQKESRTFVQEFQFE